jgi:hypothetical protein
LGDGFYWLWLLQLQDPNTSRAATMPKAMLLAK